MRHHRLGRLARSEEAREGRHLPDLAIDAGRRVADVETDIAADIEDENLDLADLGLDPGEQLGHLRLVARVGAERMNLAAFIADPLGKRLELVGVAARHDSGVALAREATGDRSARRIPRADHDADFILGHEASPLCATVGGRTRRLNGDYVMAA